MQPKDAVSRQVADRWTPRLADAGWTPISDVFLANYHRLKISHSEAMVIIHLMSFKWDQSAPFPSVGTIARRMGISPPAVRSHFRSLGKKGLLTREKTGSTNRFHLNALFQALEVLLDRDEEARRGSVKITVRILLRNKFGMGRLVGYVDFTTLPVKTANDFLLRPPDVVLPEEAFEIGKQLSSGQSFGALGRIEWSRGN